MASKVMQDAVSPSTPKAQSQRNLQPINAENDMTSTSRMQVDSDVASEAMNEPSESDNQKEAWKKRKQM